MSVVPSSRRVPRVLVLAPYPWRFGLFTFYQRALARLSAEVAVAYLARRNAWSSPVYRVRNALIRRSAFARNAVVRASERRVLEEIAAFKPELVLVVSGNQVSVRCLREIRNLGRPALFHVYSDNPFFHHGVASRFFEALREYDCFFTFARFLVPALYQQGARRVEYLPFAHDPETHFPVAVSAADLEVFRSSVAYLGTWGPLVERWLTYLEPFGLKVWGLSWEHLPLGSPLRPCWQRPGRDEKGMGTTMGQVCAAAEVVFNLVRAEHGCAHSMKTFEIPACRGFMLTNRTDEQSAFLEEDREAVYFSSVEEMLDKARFYLAHEDLRAKIATAGWERVQPETYAERATRILRVFDQLRER